MPRPRKKPVQWESFDQRNLVEYARAVWPGIFIVPGLGGKDIPHWLRALLSRNGYSNGQPDLMFFVVRRPYNFLAVEMKHGRNKPTEAQMDRLRDCAAMGALSVVVWGLQDGKRVLKAYMSRNFEQIHKMPKVEVVGVCDGVPS